MIVIGNASTCKTHDDVTREVPAEKVGIYLEHFTQCVLPRWLALITGRR